MLLTIAVILNRPHGSGSRAPDIEGLWLDTCSRGLDDVLDLLTGLQHPLRERLEIAIISAAMQPGGIRDRMMSLRL